MRYSKLTSKDMTVLTEQDSAREQFKQTRGALRDYSGQHKVEMFWDLSDEHKKEMIFRLDVDEHSVLLDKEQLARLLRWV